MGRCNKVTILNVRFCVAKSRGANSDVQIYALVIWVAPRLPHLVAACCAGARATLERFPTMFGFYAQVFAVIFVFAMKW